jgi:hypothetical protein
LLIDNTEISQVCVQAEKGIIKLHHKGFNWVDDFIASLQTKNPVSIKDLSSIEEVRKLYETSKKKSERK